MTKRIQKDKDGGIRGYPGSRSSILKFMDSLDEQGAAEFESCDLGHVLLFGRRQLALRCRPQRPQKLLKSPKPPHQVRELR